MSARYRALLAIAVVVACATPLLPAQTDKDEQLPAQLPIEQLLAGPERKDFKCDIDVRPPRLTFQQRDLVQVKAEVDPSNDERKHALDLYFVLKVADAAGTWLPDDTFRRFQVPAGFDKNSAIEYLGGFYATPGNYTAALIVYDATSGKVSVVKKAFEVKAPKNDPLPELGRDLPAIDFVRDVPSDEPPVTSTSHFGHPRALDFETAHPEDEWPPANGIAYLPVRNKRPLLVDVVLNVAPSAGSLWQSSTSQSRYRITSGMIVQAGTILSQLGLDHGCVEVSAIDLAQLQVVFERMPARDADWHKLSKQVAKRNNATISVAALGKKSATGDFLEKYIDKLTNASPECAGTNGLMDHAIVFVSRNFDFPSGTQGTHLEQKPEHRVRYFLLRLSRSGGGDDLARFFKPADAVKFDANSPEEFRGVLPKLVVDLSGDRKK